MLFFIMQHLPFLTLLGSGCLYYAKTEVDAFRLRQTEISTKLDKMLLSSYDSDIAVLKKLNTVQSSVQLNDKKIEGVLNSTKGTINLVSSDPSQFYLGVTSGDILSFTFYAVGTICIIGGGVVLFNNLMSSTTTNLKIIDSNNNLGIDVIRTDLSAGVETVVTTVAEAAQVTNLETIKHNIGAGLALIANLPPLKGVDAAPADVMMLEEITKHVATSDPTVWNFLSYFT